MSDAAAPAATLVLVRPAAAGFELLMIDRATTMGFAAGAMVFPGGKVDDSDVALAADASLAPGFAALDPVDAAARIAAVRETFEEAGVLVTTGPAIDEATRAEWRPRVAAHEASFAGFLRLTGHILDAAALIPFAHWCPPATIAHRRYDTRFYLAAMPAGEVALHDGGEATHSLWLSPAAALARADSGAGALIFPTRRNLERLATHDSIAALDAATRATPVRLVQPWVEQRDGRPHLCIPADAGYPVTAEALDSAMRG